MSGDDGNDFGLIMERLLRVDSIKWFGVEAPLRQSAGGPFTGINFNCLRSAEGLSVLEESHATHPQNDQIALWPSDSHPTHAIIAVEADAADPSVQVVDLKGNPDNNVKTILKGLVGSDPVRRTPWVPS